MIELRQPSEDDEENLLGYVFEITLGDPEASKDTPHLSGVAVDELRDRGRVEVVHAEGAEERFTLVGARRRGLF